MNEKEITDLTTELSQERRRFLEVAGRFGFGTAVIAGMSGTLWSDSAVAQTAADEERKEKNAKVRMNFATEYKIEDYVKYPVMQAKWKENLETLSKNQIFCKLFPQGRYNFFLFFAGRHITNNDKIKSTRTRQRRINHVGSAGYRYDEYVFNLLNSV